VPGPGRLVPVGAEGVDDTLGAEEDVDAGAEEPVVLLAAVVAAASAAVLLSPPQPVRPTVTTVTPRQASARFMSLPVWCSCVRLVIGSRQVRGHR
jgi:hypothetical protein